MADYTPEQYATDCEIQIAACGTATGLADVAADLLREIDHLDKCGCNTKNLKEALRLIKVDVAGYAGLPNDSAAHMDLALRKCFGNG
jgi:hypothetical protein